MKKIKLTKDYHALVDDSDYQRVISAGPWHTHIQRRKDGSVITVHAYTVIGMHTFLTGSKGTDHKDHNGLNNQRSNLRKATRLENSRNRRKWNRRCSSRYKGVIWDKNRKLWHSRITVDKNRMHLGYFKSERSAAKAYDVAALKHFGKFSFTNFKENNER